MPYPDANRSLPPASLPMTVTESALNRPMQPGQEPPLSNALHTLVDRVASLEQALGELENRLVPVRMVNPSGESIGHLSAPSQGTVVDIIDTTNGRLTALGNRVAVLLKELVV